MLHASMVDAMRRTRAACRWLVIVAVGVAVGPYPAAAQSGSFDWTTATSLVTGVDRGFVQITGTAPLVVNCVRIDTVAPGISFLTTPRANPWVAGVAETVRQTTSAFVSTSQTTSRKVVAAVNGDLFNTALSPTTTLEAFNVSNGTLVSPGAAPGGIGHATFSLTRSNAGAVIATDDTSTVGDTWNAVTGIYQCLLNGAPRLSGTDPQPRTGLGVSNDTRYVYMMTVDGRSSSSIGATNRQVGEWLAYFGAWNGVYVDGGGSTTMAWWNPSAPGANKAQVLNTPSDGSERAVGNNIGVSLATPTYAAGEYYWAGNGVRGGAGTWDASGTNWRSGAIYGPAVAYASGSSSVGTTAVFTGVGGQVTPAAGTTAAKITFQNSGFQLGTALAVSDVTLVGTPEIRVDVGVSATIRSRLTGTNLTIRGSGTTVDNQLKLWPLSGSNALSGTVHLVDRVRVDLGFASSLGMAAVTVQEGSAIDLRGYGVSYSNDLTLAGAGVTGSAWALRFASGDTWAGGIRLTGSTAIRLGDSGAVAASITSAMTGTGGVTYSGVAASSLVLAGRNTYAGTTTVDMGSGVVRVAVASEGTVGGVTAGAFGTGPLTLASGRVAGSDAATTRTILNPISVTGNVSLGEAFTSAPLVFAAAATISGSRTIAIDSMVTWAGTVGESAAGSFLAKTGTGTLALRGTSSYTGGGSVAAGTLVFGITAARPATGRTAVAAGATLALGVGGTGSWVASNVDQLFFTGTGAGTLARVDMDPKANVGIDTTAGSFVYGSSPGSQRGMVKLGDNTLWLTGTCTYAGGTRIEGGMLALGDGGASGSIFGNVATSGTLAINRSDAFVFSGTVSGSGQLLKAGSGTATLTAANTFTGPTRVAAGRLQIGHATALSTGTVQVAAGATLGVADFLSATVGAFDLASGGLVDVTTGQVTIAAGMTPAVLVARLVEGRGNGGWNGTSGITSSSAAADLAAGTMRAVGWLDNGDGSLLVAFAAPGDTNLDEKVDILDVANFVGSGTYDSGMPADWFAGDFTYDGFVDILDVAEMLATGLYDTGPYNPPSSGIGGVAAVPEPAVWPVAAAAIGAGIVVSRRRRRPALRTSLSP